MSDEPYYTPGRSVPSRPIEHAADALLWALVKGRHVAEARRRDVPSVGLELRFLVDGELLQSQRCRNGEELELIADLKRAEFLERGWSEPASGVVTPGVGR